MARIATLSDADEIKFPFISVGQHLIRVLRVLFFRIYPRRYQQSQPKQSLALIEQF